MVLMGLAIAVEFDRFPGGPAALAASVQASVEAFRPLRWPAERLDTLGGYLTYHNATIYGFFLGLYGAIQGARATRAAEEQGSLGLLLSTGRPRWRLLLDRALGFLAIDILISVTVGAAFALTMQWGGAPDIGGGFITALAYGLACLVAYGIGAVVAQLTRTSRGAAGAAALILVFLYVVNNVWQEVGVLGLLRFVAPLFYANRSRALVPGYGFDLPSSIAMVLLWGLLLGAAAVGFTRRDYLAPLLGRRRAQRAEPPRTTGRLPRLGVGSVWSATLLRGRFALVGWTVGTASFLALFVGLWPTIRDIWEIFATFVPPAISRGLSAADQYVSYATTLLAPVGAAFVVQQAAAWHADLVQGRVEIVSAGPTSAMRLVSERLVALLLGAAVITVGALLAMMAVGATVDVSLSVAGAVRLLATTSLLVLALGALASAVVTVLRSQVAVVLMAVILGAMYLLDVIAPMFEWPTWTHRWSVFLAFGNPYAGWPTATDIAVLGLMAAAAWGIGVLGLRRRPRVA